MMKHVFKNVLFITLTAIILVFVSCNNEKTLPPEENSSETANPSGEHICTPEIIPGKASTCTEAGYTDAEQCNECGKILKESLPLPLAEHEEKIIPAIPGTCTTEGKSEGIECAVCGEILKMQKYTDYVHGETKVIPAVEGTCDVEGKTEGLECCLCGKLLEAQKSTGYVHGNPELIPPKDGTCIVEGHTSGTKCSLCGYVFEAPISTGFAHRNIKTLEAVVGDCTNVSKSEGKMCLDCGTIIVPQVTTVTHHKYEKCEKTEPGCSTFGCEAGRRCTVCGEIEYQINLIYPTVFHDFDKDGKCKNCGFVYAPSEGIVFELVNDEYYRVVDTSDVIGETLIIPESYKGLPVRDLSKTWYSTSDFTVVYIPKTVTIGLGPYVKNMVIDPENPVYCFENGMLINKVTKTLISYRGDAEHLYVPGDGYIKTIGEYSFSYASNLKSVVFGEGIEKMEANVFFDSPKIESVTLPRTLRYLGYAALPSGCTIKGKIVHENIKFFDKGNFSYITADMLVIPKSIKVIENRMFSGSTFGKIVFHEGITEIGNRGFEGLKMAELDLPKSLKKIGDRAFDGSTITKLVIPEGVTEIGKNAFEDCKELSEIYIPASVRKIGTDVFYGCGKLTKIVVAEDNEYYYAKDGFLVEKKTKTLIGALRTGDELNISADLGLERIGRMTYYGYGASTASYPNHENSVLKFLTIPEGIREISGDSFAGAGIRNIKLPASIEVIGERAFSGCQSLADVIFTGNNLREIGASAFSGCEALEKIELPSGVKTIGDSAFADCKALKTIVLPKSVTTISERAFSNIQALEKIEIPAGVKELSAYLFYNSGNLSTAVIPDSVESFGAFLFTGTRVSEIYIPGSLKEIDNYAFINAESVKSFKLSDKNKRFTIKDNCLIEVNAKTLRFVPKLCGEFKIPADGSVSKIGVFAFIGNGNIKELVIPDAITEISDAAFANCKNLSSISLPSTLKVIGISAFSGCDMLSEVTVPGSVKDIPEYAFSGCKALTKLKLSEGTKTVGTKAFENCDSLTEVTLPNSITDIDSAAFSSCDSLEKVNFGSGIKKIFGAQFSDCPKYITYTVDAANPHYYSKNNAIIEKNTKTLVISSCYGGVAYIPDDGSVEIIATGAFLPGGIRKLVIPEGILRLEDEAFGIRNEFNIIKIPSSIEYIGRMSVYRHTAEYNGTIAEWKALEKYSSWDSGVWIICTDGTHYGIT